MRIGYIRVSRDKQTTALQEDAIQKAECKRVFIDTMSGVRDDRPEFQRMLDMARPGDVIVVWRLDRLGRSLRHLIETVNQMSERGIELQSLKENIDTTTSTGKLMFHIVGAMAEFERDIIRERTTAGLEAARARGRKGGRPKATETIKPRNLALSDLPVRSGKDRSLCGSSRFDQTRSPDSLALHPRYDLHL